MFISLFNTLKSTGVPCSLRELLDLIGAVDKKLAFADMQDFYYLSRATLVKDEKHSGLLWSKMRSTTINLIVPLISILRV